MERDKQLVVVRVGEGHCGLEVQDIKEVVKLKSITPIPHTPQFVEGLMNLRGQIVTVINLGLKLDSLEEGSFKSNPSINPANERIVVMNHSGELIGLHVDAVEQVITIDNSNLEIPDEGEFKGKNVISGVIHLNANIIMKLNTYLLLQSLSGEGGDI